MSAGFLTLGHLDLVVEGEHTGGRRPGRDGCAGRQQEGDPGRGASAPAGAASRAATRWGTGPVVAAGAKSGRPERAEDAARAARAMARAVSRRSPTTAAAASSAARSAASAMSARTGRSPG